MVTTDGIFVPCPRSCSEMLSPNGMEFGGASLGGDEDAVGDPPSGVSILIKSPRELPNSFVAVRSQQRTESATGEARPVCWHPEVKLPGFRAARSEGMSCDPVCGVP